MVGTDPDPTSPFRKGSSNQESTLVFTLYRNSVSVPLVPYLLPDTLTFRGGLQRPVRGREFLHEIWYPGKKMKDSYFDREGSVIGSCSGKLNKSVVLPQRTRLGRGLWTPGPAGPDDPNIVW